MGRVTVTFKKENFDALMTVAALGLGRAASAASNKNAPSYARKDIQKTVEHALDALLDDVVLESSIDESVKASIVMAIVYTLTDDNDKIHRDIEALVKDAHNKDRKNDILERLKKKFGDLDGEE